MERGGGAQLICMYKQTMEGQLEQPKVGQLHVQPYKNGEWVCVRVELTKEHLVVRRRDVVYEDTIANNDIVEEKHITLQRDEQSRLGILIMGGLDFKCPIKIYKITEGTPAQRCRELHQGDVLLEVNGISMWGLDHDDAVAIIKQSGDEVTLHTGQLRLREIEEQLMVDEEWFTMTTIPLQMASVTRYQAGTAILRPNGFELVSRNGKDKVCVRCDEVQGNLDEWLASITTFITKHTKDEMERYNNNVGQNEKIVKMGWVHEQLPSTVHANVWQRKLLVLKRDCVQIHASMPDNIAEWERPEKCYKLLEMTVKTLEPHTLPEQRASCMLITSGTGHSHVISCETKGSIADWTSCIHHTTVEAVQTQGHMRYCGRWRERDVQLVLDIDQGMQICSSTDPCDILWRKPFSLLRQSSDDGRAKLKLTCAIKQSKIADTQDVELEDLQLAICGLECFMAAKVAMLDPAFIQQHTDIIAY